MKSLTTFLIICYSIFSLDAQSISTHTSTASNTLSNATLVKQSKSGNNPNATIIVTHNWGSNGKYNNHPIGVEWKNNEMKIVNLDGAKMPAGIKFNILRIRDNKLGTLHKVKPSNLSGHVTFIDNSRWNNKPNVKLLVTQCGTNTYNANSVGIYYAGGEWAIYNQNKKAIPVGASFYIYECQDCEVITANSPSGNYYNFNLAAKQPNANLFVTQFWTKVYNPHEVGLWYNGGKWSVYNEDRKPLPRNSKFIVGRGTILKAMSPRVFKSATALPAPPKKMGKIKLNFYGISVDDHQENTWGEVKYCLQKKSSNGKYVEVKPEGRSSAWLKWSARKTNPLMCYPYPRNGSPIRNINQSNIYTIDDYAIGRGEYRIKYEMKLTCNHKDNAFASDGDHAMRSFVTDYIKVLSTDKPEIFTLPGKKHKTDSNRVHTFRAQFGAVVMK